MMWKRDIWQFAIGGRLPWKEKMDLAIYELIVDR